MKWWSGCVRVVVALAVIVAMGVGVSARDAMLDAIELGDLAKVKALVEAEPAVVTRAIEYHGQPLHVALAKYKLEIARYLLEQGASVNEPDKFGQNALFKLVGLARGEDARFALIKELCQMLIARKVDLAACDGIGRTPLFFLAEKLALNDDDQRRKFELVDLLLAAGSSIKDLGKKGKKSKDDKIPTPLLALVLWNEDFRAIAVSDVAAGRIEEAARVLPRRLLIETIRNLLDRGADPNAPDWIGDTPMMKVLRQDPAALPVAQQVEIIEMLIDYGAKPRTKNIQGESPETKAKGNAELEQALKHKPVRKKPTPKR